MRDDRWCWLASSESSPECEASENGTSSSAREACDTEPGRNRDRVLGQRSESIDRIRFGRLRSRWERRGSWLRFNWRLGLASHGGWSFHRRRSRIEIGFQAKCNEKFFRSGVSHDPNSAIGEKHGNAFDAVFFYHLRSLIDIDPDEFVRRAQQRRESRVRFQIRFELHAWATGGSAKDQELRQWIFLAAFHCFLPCCCHRFSGSCRLCLGYRCLSDGLRCCLPGDIRLGPLCRAWLLRPQ